MILSHMGIELGLQELQACILPFHCSKSWVIVNYSNNSSLSCHHFTHNCLFQYKSWPPSTNFSHDSVQIKRLKDLLRKPYIVYASNRRHATNATYTTVKMALVLDTLKFKRGATSRQIICSAQLYSFLSLSNLASFIKTNNP